MSDSDSTTSAKTCSKCGQLLPIAQFSNGGKRAWCRGCVAAYDRMRRAAKAEVLRAKARAYYLAHREERIEAARQWAEANPVKRAAIVRKYYEANRDAVIAASCKAGKEHPERGAAVVRNRRARLRGSLGRHTAEDIRQQYARQNGRCFYCGAKVGKKYHVDHVIPVSKGGSNGPENLVIACRPCNDSKGAKHPMDFAGILF